MKILRRTTGIDTRAKNIGLHGSVIIQFRDPITGKVTDEEKHDNFFTDALDSILNGCPWGLDKVTLNGGGIRGSEYATDCICDTLLGGILVFPESLGTDTDGLYPPFDTNYPTAYASKRAYNLTDTKQGLFNNVESQRLSNGYRYVYDWGTSYGTGRISAVALSHQYAFKYFNDGYNMINPFGNTSNTSTGFPACIHRQFSGAPSRTRYIAASDDGFVVCLSNTDELYFFEIKPYDIQLNQYNGTAYSVLFDTENPLWKWKYTYTKKANTIPTIQFVDGDLWIVERADNASESTNVYFTIIDISDGSVTSEYTRTFACPMASSQKSYAIKDGILYASSRNGGKIFKCRISDGVVLGEIESTAIVANEPLQTSDGSDNIYGKNIIMNHDIVIAHENTDMSINEINNDTMAKVIYENGVWRVIGSGGFNTTYGQCIGAQIKTPYCATKNNLDSVKTKSTDKTMKITYVVTQV